MTSRHWVLLWRRPFDSIVFEYRPYPQHGSFHFISIFIPDSCSSTIFIARISLPLRRRDGPSANIARIARAKRREKKIREKNQHETAAATIDIGKKVLIPRFDVVYLWFATLNWFASFAWVLRTFAPLGVVSGRKSPNDGTEFDIPVK